MPGKGGLLLAGPTLMGPESKLRFWTTIVNYDYCKESSLWQHLKFVWFFFFSPKFLAQFFRGQEAVLNERQHFQGQGRKTPYARCWLLHKRQVCLGKADVSSQHCRAARSGALKHWGSRVWVAPPDSLPLHLRVENAACATQCLRCRPWPSFLPEHCV